LYLSGDNAQLPSIEPVNRKGTSDGTRRFEQQSE